MSDTLDDTELGQLLAQLLRLVSPAAGDGAAGADVPGNGASSISATDGAAAAAGAAADVLGLGHAAPVDGRPLDAVDGAASAAGVPQL